MKKRQLIATLACLLVGMAGFAGAYTMEQSDQSQSQQQAEISTTELSQVSGVIEPETADEDLNGSEAGDEPTKNGDGSDAKEDETQTVTTSSMEGTDIEKDDVEEGNSEAVTTNADIADESGGNVDASGINGDTNASATGTDASADAETVDADTIQFAAELRWPLESGNVILNYSMDHMVYFETLEQYQYNPAMIISAEVGDKVYVVAEGMITDISTNEVTGLTVTEDLGDGYTAIYGQLSDVNFAVGDTVERGHVLGYVAETTKYYSVEGTNLYFAMELNGESINPLEYFAD